MRKKIFSALAVAALAVTGVGGTAGSASAAESCGLNLHSTSVGGGYVQYSAIYYNCGGTYTTVKVLKTDGKWTSCLTAAPWGTVTWTLVNPGNLSFKAKTATC